MKISMDYEAVPSAIAGNASRDLPRKVGDVLNGMLASSGRMAAR